MRRKFFLAGLIAFAVVALAAGAARATSPTPASFASPAAADNQRAIALCLMAAARVYHLPPSVLVILLNVEGGELGRVSQNTNDTVDIGPMQVNSIWIPQVAAHWHATRSAAFLALRDSFCANVEAGAWILRQGLDEAHGDFWQGVGYYHSHDPGEKSRYLRAVLQQVLRLQTLAGRTEAPATPRLVQAAPPRPPAPSGRN